MLYKEIPFVRFTLPLVIGIIIGSVWSSLPPIPLLIYALVCLLPAIFIPSGQRLNILFGILSFQFFLICGYLLFNNAHSRIISQDLFAGEYNARIDNYPQSREKSIRVEATVEDKNQKGKAVFNRSIVLYFPLSSSIINTEPGDIVRLNLRPELISDFNPDDKFDYSKYMLYRGFRYSAYVPSPVTLIRKCLNTRHRAQILRKRLLNKYALKIDKRESLNIVSALSLGYKDNMPEDIRSTFRDAGISHILAVSGLHVGIVSMLIIGFLSLLRIRSNILILGLSLAGVWCFALISGMTASVCRASIMFSFLYTGRYLGRHINPLNSLFASAFILLLANPFTLFSAGFQLSYSAVLAILLFYRKLNALGPFSGIIMSRSWSLITVTLLAQFGTLPLVLYHFRQLPLLSILTNIFAIPLAFCILLSGFLFLACPLDFFLSDFLAHIIEFETVLLYSISDLIASIPGTILILNH
ncbi:MAG: ComEC/Rec2 family competence protein [Bacteroidales bacterium]|nr:ComEC/Rec2 family competence protein [Bacteroidales bacterium]